MTVQDQTGAPPVTFTETFESADPQAVDRLGGKGSGLARMTQDGLRVPPGYIISTDACRHYLSEDAIPAGLREEVSAQLAALEERSGKTFGRGPLPLLLSVRSGAPISMPGMMDTILNLGLGRDAAVDLATACADTRFVAELTARFHSMYSEIVLGALDAEDGVREVVEQISADDPAAESYDRVWQACERALQEDSGGSVPSDPFEQLLGAVEAVFRSWNTRRARAYRDFHGIPHDLGTAVVVQSMVFGNMSADSGSGVAFTRNPVTGEPGLFGEYLANSQGEDVVAGTRTPDPVATALDAPLLDELTSTGARLEAEYGDVLDIEFTVERGTLYFLQVRSAKRTPEAAVRIAADLLAEGTISPHTALHGVSPEQIRQVQRPGFDADEVETARAGDRVLTTGVGACPGQVSGLLVLDPDRAQSAAADGTAVVLARTITSPADLHGMIAAQGIVTATGGSTSHAAVVARALGTCCVVGASDMAIDEQARTLTIGGRTLSEGDPVSLDGSTGELFAGEFQTSTPAAANAALSSLLSAATASMRCDVFAKVAVPSDVAAVRAAGATGLLVSLDDLTTAAGHGDEIVEELIRDGATGEVGELDRIAELVAAALGPVLDTAGDITVLVQGLDLLVDRPGATRTGSELLTALPHLALTFGIEPLIRAQIDGLTRAVGDTRGAGRVHFLATRVSDPAEAATLGQLARSSESAMGTGSVLACPRSLFHLAEIASHNDELWVDLHALHSAVFGLPGQTLSAPGPLDSYLERGLFALDPRVAIDPSVAAMLEQIAPQAWEQGTAERNAGLRLTGAISTDVVAALYDLGARRFAVDADEVRPLLLAVGRSASAV